MIKKLIIILALAALALPLVGCGGGNSSSSVPVGVNPGVASKVQLMATSYVNQTNGYCYLKTKVIDGNGLPMKNVEVIFTNLSILGVLDHTTAVTGSNGIATATVYSTEIGFVTIQAEVRTGTERIRDKKTVFFSPFDLSFPSSSGTVNFASLSLDVDSNNNGIFNETSDFIMFDPPGKTDAIIRATVTGSTGARLVNSAVTFGADSPEVTFPTGSPSDTAPVVHTDSNGQASILARVSASIVRAINTVVNITAKADNNTFNVVSLFLEPVTVTSIDLSALPTTIPSAGTSTISAVVNTNGGLAPDGTNVNFVVVSAGLGGLAGNITPFSSTTGGIAKATLTAPATFSGGTITVRASAGGINSNDVPVTVTAATPPTVPPVEPDPVVAIPSAFTVNTSLLPKVVTIQIKGGLGGYVVTSSNPLQACNDLPLPGNNDCSDFTDSGIWSNVLTGQITVTIPAGVPAGSITLNIADLGEATPKTATVTITVVAP